MNILNITNHCIFPPTTWWSRFIYNFLKFLSNKNNVFFINEKNNSSYKNDLENIKTFEIIKNWKIKFLDFLLIIKIIKIIKENKIDVIIMEYPWFWLYIYFVKKITWVKVILQEHNLEFERFKSNKYWWWKILYYYEKWVYKIVDDIFYISSEDKKNAEKYFWIKNKWQICNYWINSNLFNTNWNQDSKAKLKEQYKINENKKIISFFWKLDYYPNTEALDIIFENIYPKLIEKKLNFKLIINWNPIPEKYKNLKNIIFTWNVINIQDYIKWCNIMINPILSWWWVKTKVIESIACWKTIISTKKWAEWINEQITDWKLIVVENNDWENFTQEIIKNIDNTDFVSDLFIKEYEWNNIINNLKF